MSYYADLTFQLRQRGLAEERIVAVLKEIEDFSRESGQSPEAAFGKPEEYALKFPDESPGTGVTKGGWGSRLFVASVYLATAVNGLNLLLRLPGRGFVDNTLVLLLASLGFVFVVGLVGMVIDRRLPKGFAKVED